MPPTISQTAINDSAAGGFRRVLSLRDLVLFGIAFIGPTAPYSMFGIATVKSQRASAAGVSVAMVAMGFTALSYGRMASAFPEAGSTYSLYRQSAAPGRRLLRRLGDDPGLHPDPDVERDLCRAHGQQGLAGSAVLGLGSGRGRRDHGHQSLWHPGDRARQLFDERDYGRLAGLVYRPRRQGAAGRHG